MTALTIYTCAIGSHDWVHCPRVVPAGARCLRFSDRAAKRCARWEHRAPPEVPGARTMRAIARFTKVRPHVVVPDCEVAVWIDSSVELMSDISPLVEQFRASGADIAMFPHPSGRTVAEEIDHAIAAKRIPADFHAAAAAQRARYAEAGLLDRKVVESTILFYRMSSDALRRAGELWWEELATYTERDQVSQPYAMRDEALKVLYWDWHFDQPNPYMRRLPHRPQALLKRLKTGAHFLGDIRWDYRLVRGAIRAGSRVKRLLGGSAGR